MKRSILSAFIALIAFSEAALACHPRIVDPLVHIARDGSPEFTTIFVGELVGMRKPKRIQRMKEQWGSKNETGQSSDARELAHVTVGGGVDLQIEVFPTQVLLGEPARPHTVTLGGCALPSLPELGAKVMVFVTEENWGVYERRPSDGELREFGSDYVERVRRCLNGDCDPDQEQ